MILPIYQETYWVADGSSELGYTLVHQTDDGQFAMYIQHLSGDVSGPMNCETMWNGLGGEHMTVQECLERWYSEYNVSIIDVEE